MHVGSKLVPTLRPSAADWEDVGAVFRALGSPLRVGIVMLLTEREHSVNELVAELDVSQPLVSQHLRVLRTARIVTSVRRGREMIYSLTDEHAGQLVALATDHVAETPAFAAR